MMDRPFVKFSRASAPFWASLESNALSMQRCKQCNRLVFYPREICPYCSANNFTWEKVSGRGRVYSFTIVRKPSIPSFKYLAPYVYAIIELEEGIRLASNVINCMPEDVVIDMPVRPVFEKTPSSRTVLLFEPDLG
jgi:uncharacterized OB-fold protein